MTYPVADDEAGVGSDDDVIEGGAVDILKTLEDELAQCLRTYRHGAEEIVARHMDALEKAESARELELHMLRAENGKLRRLLGLADTPCDIKLFQGVNVSANAGKAGKFPSPPGSRKPSRTSQEGTASARCGVSAPVRSTGPWCRPPMWKSSTSLQSVPKPAGAASMTRAQQRNRNIPTRPGAEGSWENFVAWVPHGSMLQSTEPWRPLQSLHAPPSLITSSMPPSMFTSSRQISDTKHISSSVSLGFDVKKSLLNSTALSLNSVCQSSRTPSVSIADFTRVLPNTLNAELETETAVSPRPHDDEDSNTESSNMEDGLPPLELLECWVVSKSKLNKLRTKARLDSKDDRQSVSTGISSCNSGLSGLSEGDSATFEEFREHNPFIMHPHCKKRLAWDFASLGLVTYDMVMVPMSAFNLQESDPFLVTMSWVTRLFWTLDMGWSVLTGVLMKDGSVKLDFRYILTHYFKTWFALDVLIVSSDWIEVALSQSGIGGIGKLARIFRIARAVRLLRLVRMQSVLQAITERIQSDNIILMVSVLKMIVFVISMSHAVACVWFAVGAGEDVSTSWVANAGYSTAAIPDQYLASLHWALSQYNGGMEEIMPVTPGERLFAILVWMFSFFATGIIVSILTSNLTRAYMVRGQQVQQASMLRRYMKQNGVSGRLALRIQRSAQYAAAAELTEDTIELLHDVSEPLRMEMHLEMYSPLLTVHAFFADVASASTNLVRHICHEAMFTEFLSAGDVVFTLGEEPREPRMYIVWSGNLEYEDSGKEITAVCGNDVVSEASLWTNWKHRGRLASITEAKLACLDGGRFQDIMQRYSKVRGVNAPLYAADFLEFANKAHYMNDLTRMST